MSWVRIWVHIVFGTKKRNPFLHTAEIRRKVFKHIKDNALEKNIYLDCVNGYSDHAHCLISLGKEQTISKVVQLIKGESSFWINKNKIISKHFNWQDDFWAVSVSERNLRTIRKYIYRQEEHHKRTSFSEELDDFIKEHGFQLVKDE